MKITQSILKRKNIWVWMTGCFALSLIALNSCSETVEKDDEKQLPAVEERKDSSVSTEKPSTRPNRHLLSEDEKKFADFVDNGGTVQGVVLALDSPLPGMTLIGNVEFIPKREDLGLIESPIPNVTTMIIDTNTLPKVPEVQKPIICTGLLFPKLDNLAIVANTIIATTQAIVGVPGSLGICSVTSCVGLDVVNGSLSNSKPTDLEKFCAAASSKDSCKRYPEGEVVNSCQRGLTLDESCPSVPKDPETTPTPAPTPPPATCNRGCDPGTTRQSNPDGSCSCVSACGPQMDSMICKNLNKEQRCIDGKWTCEWTD